MYGLVTIIVGALVAVQSRINGQLATTVHNGIAGALLSNLAGWVFLWALVFGLRAERLALKKVISAWKNKKIKWWEFTGGLGGGFFLSMQSINVPQIGVAIFTIATIGGQTVTSLIVDKIGISPSGKKHITIPRVVGAVTTLVAVTIAVKPELTGTTFKLVPIVLTVLVGAVVAFQQAINGRLNVVTGRPLATSWINFSIGSMVLTTALVINLLNGGHISKLPSNPWLYLGGPLGLFYIAISAYVVKHMGVLNFILFSVTGQLIGALLLDWLVPATKNPVSGYLIFGTLMTLASIAASQLFENKVTNRQR